MLHMYVIIVSVIIISFIFARKDLSWSCRLARCLYVLFLPLSALVLNCRMGSTSYCRQYVLLASL